MTENAPEQSGKPSEEPENLFAPHSADLLSEEEKEQLQNPEKCRELTRKYISGLSYLDFEALVTDWDSSNAGDILTPSLYDAIYRIHTGKTLPSDTRRIPAEEYEDIMTTYFPVTGGQLRERCGYDEDSGCSAAF